MHIIILSKKLFLPFTLFLLFIFTVNSCGIYKPTDSRKVPTNANERIKKNIEEGRGFRLGKLGNRGSGKFEFATSNPLWRATLEKLNFTPLSNVDYGGGIIITDWFSNEESDEQIKITIRFLSNEIRSDAIDVILHKKTCKTSGNCRISKIENSTNSEIRLAILKKAAQLEKLGVAKKRSENKGDVKLPKEF